MPRCEAAQRRLVGTEVAEDPGDHLPRTRRVDTGAVAKDREFVSRDLRKERPLDTAADRPEEGDVVHVAELIGGQPEILTEPDGEQAAAKAVLQRQPAQGPSPATKRATSASRTLGPFVTVSVGLNSPP